MQALLEERELWDYVTGEKKKPSETTASDNEGKELLANWIKADGKARRQMILCMTSGELRGTAGAKSAKELWDLLVMRKESVGSAGLNSALALLFKAKAETEGDIPEHLTKIKELQERIHTNGLKFGLDLPDWMFTAIMINTLPSTWESFTNGYAGSMAVDTTDKENKSPYRVKSHEMQSILLDEWRRRNPSGTVSEDTALFSKGERRNKGVRTNEGVKCHNCGKMGHKMVDCWAPGGGAEGKKPQWKRKGKAEHKANFADDKDPFEVAYLANKGDMFTAYDWLADSGSSTHIAIKRNVFKEYKELNDETIKGIGGQRITAAGRGTVILTFEVNGKKILHTLRDVLHVPNAENNLVSIGRIDASGNRMVFGEGNCQIMHKGHVVGEGKLTRNLYLLRAKAQEWSERAMVAKEGENESWDEWHRRFGHVSAKSLQDLKRKEMVSGFNVDMESKPTECEACIQSKLVHRPFPAEATTRAEKPGELTYSDLWGPARTQSIGGARYFMSFTDDYSRKISVVFLKDKSEATERMKEYITYLERKWERLPKAIRVDNGKEFVNKELTGWCRKKGIDLQRTAPYSPSQNGVAERFNRTLMELSRAMLIAKDLPHFLWAEAVSYAAYIRSSVPTRALNDKTPYEAWTGQKPNVSHLREFGASVWIYDEGDTGKLLPRANKHIFVGFQEGPKAVRYYDAGKRSIKISRNYRFSEAEKSPTVEAEEIEIEGEKVSLEGEKEKFESERRETDPNVSDKGADSDGEEEIEINVPVVAIPKPPTRPKAMRSLIPTRVQPYREKSAANKLLAAGMSGGNYRPLSEPETIPDRSRRYALRNYNELANLAIAFKATESPAGVTFDGAPRSLDDAMKRPDWPKFRSAMVEELTQLQAMGTWAKTGLPAQRKAIGNRWVFAIKKNELGEIVRYKARLVAQGFSQIPGVDYSDTFAPVVRFDSLRTVLALAAINDWEVQAIDIKGAYLAAELKEELYMRQPEGFADGTDDVLQLKKAIYGLKQAGHDFHELLKTLLTNAGFEKCPADPGVFVRREGSKVVVLTVWVDDIVLAGNSIEMMNFTKRKLGEKLEVKDLGEPKFILGLEITRDREKGTISLGQQNYIETILKRFGFENMAPVSAPMEPNKGLTKREGPVDKDLAAIYATAIGSLMYAAIGTRPDIAFAVQNLSQFTSNPGPEHWQAVKRVFRYLSGTRGHQLTYGAHESSTEVIGYSDADWASNPNDRKSISGYVFMLGGGAITWSSKKQNVVALSSAEAEYVAETHAAKEAIWLRHLLDFMGFTQTNPTIIWADNQAAIKLTQNATFHARTKHIDTRLHFLRDKVNDNSIVYDYVPTQQNIADVFTKGLPKQTHRGFAEDIGVLPA